MVVEELLAAEALERAEAAALQDYVHTYSSMKPQDAVKVFDSMMPDQSGLSVKILQKLMARQRGHSLADERRERRGADNQNGGFRMLKDVIHGFCMALADSVPGVSGGTIAFIMGFYDKFIGSIHDLTFGKMQEKKSAVKYLARLGIGWGIGMAIIVGITWMNKKTGGASMDLAQISPGMAFRLFLIGMAAISAMFLPGISGSTLLLIFGAYIPVITAV